MRTMIFGDVASGKSTFADRLGDLTQTPVVHLDQLMQEVGRDNHERIVPLIHEAANQPHWIIEGNAFTKDPDYRIECADHIIVFDFPRIVSLAHHVGRTRRVQKGHEMPFGGVTGDLNLPYYIPYILRDFPKRKAAAIKRAEEKQKPLTFISSRRQAQDYLDGV